MDLNYTAPLLEKDKKLRVCFIIAFEIYYDEFRRVFPKIKVDCFVHKPVSMEKLAESIKKEFDRMNDSELA